MGKIASASLRSCRPRAGFTLGEVLIAIAILTLIVVFIMQLMKGAMAITAPAHKRIDSDSQALQVFDRMAADFNQMTKRTDVSYYFKAADKVMAGNDQIAFFTSVAGHFPQSNGNSDASLVAYRVNAAWNDPSAAASYDRLERMGKGLLLDGVSGSIAPIVFLPLTISGTWPNAISSTATDSDYGLSGPQIFRFEYYYLLNPNGPSQFSNCSTANQGQCLSAGPWADDASFKIKDVAAIIVAVGMIDPKSRSLLTKPQMEFLAGTHGQTSPFVDFAAGMKPGEILSTWKTALANNPQIATMARPATQNVRFYERYFPLSQ